MTKSKYNTRSTMPSKYLSFCMFLMCSTSKAFVPLTTTICCTSPQTSTSRFTTALQASSKPDSKRHSTNLFYRDSSDIDIAALSNSNSKTPSSDFQSRMKRIVTQRRETNGKRTSAYRPVNVMTVETLEEFHKVIEQGRNEDKVVVVRWFATWCKLCHSLRPAFDKLASMHPNAIFVDVPVTDTNANLHQGLNIDSVPYAHVYSPTESLVEETKLSRKNFSEFAGLVGKHCS
mmetsp:Transcript_15213/g.32891  ORF Transcript_15213/g.32891 Transcript_15213/m.32891 type:complete len:232 (+) Transcript_15213:249-944(+)